MKKLILITLSFLTLSALSGCTDATIGKVTSLGKPAHVVCYSGVKAIYDGHSTGKVISEKNSDGYFFKSRETGKFKEVSGNCDITYDE